MNTCTIVIDGTEVQAQDGDTVLVAAERAGVYIPRLCWHPELSAAGHCRLCTVRVNGRPMNACTMTVFDGMVIETDTEELNVERRHVLEMLFVSGNHFCPACETSGNCELQALAYRLGMAAPRYEYLFPKLDVDSSHPDVYIDRNRCVLCTRCVRASREIDGKAVFALEGRGIDTQIVVDADNGLAETDLQAVDRAASICPTGSIVVKHRAFETPYGERRWDEMPIGAEVEQTADRSTPPGPAQTPAKER